MRVRRLMLLGMALAFGLLVVHQVIVETLEQQRVRIDALQLGMGRVSRDASGLLALTQEYLTRHSPRARRQWHAMSAELAQTLTSLDGEAAGLHDDIEALQNVTKGLSPLFATLEGARAANPTEGDTARIEMLSDHLVAETQRISNGAFDLASRLIDVRSDQMRRLRAVTLAANAALAALLVALVVLILRRVLRPLHRLEAAAQRVEAGNLEARSNYRAADEFGHLSQRFDAMTQSLQERQAALEATQRDLRTVLDAVPSMIGYWDKNLVNRVANHAYHTWFGVDPGTLPGHKLVDLLGPELFEANRRYIEAALRGEPQTFERSIPSPDGRILRHSLAHYLPDIHDDGVHGFYVVVHDVTELTEGRRRLVTALQENAALLASIQAYSLFSELDVEGRIVEVNDNVCRLTGYSREEMIGQTYAIHQPTLRSGDFQTVVWDKLVAGQAWQGEIGGVAKSGSRYWTHAVMAPVKAADGSIRKYVSIRTDVTAQRRMALEVERSNERFELAANAAGIGVWEFDLTSNTLVWDDRMYSLYGRSRSGAAEPYALWSESVHPEDKPASELALNDAIAGLREFDPQFRIVRPDGEVRFLKAMARVVRDAADKPLRMIGVNIDLTERLHTEAALQANESLLRRVGRLAKVGGWRLDLRTGKLHWSEQTRVIHEVPDDFEPTMDSAIAFYAAESRPVVSDAVERARRTGAGWDLELRLVTHKGRSIWVRAMGEVESEGGRPVQLLGAFQDITERRQTDDLLRAAIAAAEAANSAKSLFLANMSHEIRTPLNAIIGVTHLLSETPLGEQQRRLLGQAEVAGRSLLGIVNDVLDLSKIEAGEMTLDEAAYKPAALLNELQMLYATQAAAKGLEFEANVASDVPPWLVGDRGRLQQMLTNLLANALKFTMQGSVRLELGVIDASDTQCRLVMTVRDTGIGIAPEVQAELFTPFVQADASTTRRYGGTGLGLSIVKRLATLMGGEVGVRSQPGEGSEFWAAIPQCVPSPDDLRAREADEALMEVLVVDDSPADRLDLTSQVRALGWQASTLDSGDALVKEVRHRVVTGRPLPDALLIDWQMPGIDGLQAVGLLVAEVGRKRLPATLMVSSSDRRQVASADQDGLADDILTKPVTTSVLFNAVNQSLSRRFGTTDKVLQSTRLTATDALWLAGIRLLLVDDSDINLDVARQLLERQGAQVRTCGNGLAALQVLRAGPEEFDAVLMDVQMPVLDGLEATRRLRRELMLTELPVIALTAGALVEERRRALESGMNEFLTKPLDPTELVRTVRRVVQRRRGSELLVGRTPSHAAMASPWPAIEGIDSDDAAMRLGNDAALFLSILDRMLREFGDLAGPDGINTEGAESAATLLARVHKLRGSAGSVGAREVHRLAGEAESALRAASPDAPSALSALSSALARLTQVSEPQRKAAREAEFALAATEPVTSDQIEALADGLRRRDLAAVDLAQAIVPNLRAKLGSEAADELLRAVSDLDYPRALDLLLPLIDAERKIE